MTKIQKNIFIAMLSGIFLISLAYSFSFRVAPAVDARAYDTIAWNIVQGYGYRESLETPLANDNAIIRVGPGYEYFLAAVYFITGHRYEVVWVIQALFLSLTALCMFFLTKEIFRDSWHWIMGIVAAALIGFSPDLITTQAMLLTETLGLFCLVIAVYLFFYYLNRGFNHWHQAVFVGCVIGIAGLVRTPSLFLLFPVICYFVWKKQWSKVALIIIAGFLMFVPWTIRNYIVYQRVIVTNEASGFNLLAGNHPGANGEQEPYPLLDEYVKNLGYLQANNQATKDAFQFIAHHPLEFLKLTLYRVSIYFSFARPTGFWFHLHGISRAITLLFSSLYSAILFLLGSFGIYTAVRHGRAEGKRRVFLFLAMLVMMPLAIIGVIVETRYRFPVYPFFAVFAGYGLKEFIEKKIAWKPILLIAVLLIANTAFDALRNLQRILERITSL